MSTLKESPLGFPEDSTHDLYLCWDPMPKSPNYVYDSCELRQTTHENIIKSLAPQGAVHELIHAHLNIKTNLIYLSASQLSVAFIPCSCNFVANSKSSRSFCSAAASVCAYALSRAICAATAISLRVTSQSAAGPATMPGSDAVLEACTLSAPSVGGTALIRSSRDLRISNSSRRLIAVAIFNEFQASAQPCTTLKLT